MIGSAPFSANVNRIWFESTTLADIAENIRDNTFSTGDAYGFSIEDSEPSLISAHLLLTRPEVRQVYDDDTNSVVSEEIQSVEMIPFRIDSRYGTLEVLSDRKNTNSVSNKLGELVNWNIAVEKAKLQPKAVLDEIQSEYQAEITSVKISGYHLTETVTGNIQISISDQILGRDLIDEYQGQISYLGVRVGEENSVTIGIYKSGSVMVYNDLGEYSSILDTVKRVASGAVEEQ